MTKPDHLANDLLLRAIDDELPGAEIVPVELHLQDCEECRRNYQELRRVSGRIESLVAALQIEHSLTEREGLAVKLEDGQRSKTIPQSSEKVLRRFGWGVAMAATLAIGIILVPSRRAPEYDGAEISDARSSGAFQVDGETFTPLPYSNPELPMNASHIVEMQVPVSSLAEAGIVFEPVSNQVSEQDASVPADVLLGVDGQPLGVHVLNAQ